MEYVETYDDIRELTEDVFNMLKQLGRNVKRRDVIIEIDVKEMEIAVYENSDQDMENSR